jgi:hypothetical protein
MDGIFIQALEWWERLVFSSEPTARNLMFLVVSIALYGAFLTRGDANDLSYRRTRRSSRCPDSILRDGGGRARR